MNSLTPYIWGVLIFLSVKCATSLLALLAGGLTCWSWLNGNWAEYLVQNSTIHFLGLMVFYFFSPLDLDYVPALWSEAWIYLRIRGVGNNEKYGGTIKVYHRILRNFLRMHIRCLCSVHVLSSTNQIWPSLFTMQNEENYSNSKLIHCSTSKPPWLDGLQQLTT